MRKKTRPATACGVQLTLPEFILPPHDLSPKINLELPAEDLPKINLDLPPLDFEPPALDLDAGAALDLVQIPEFDLDNLPAGC